MNESTRRTRRSLSGLVGVGASILSALVFVLHQSLNQTEWLVLMLLALLGFFATAVAAWVRSLWWLFGVLFSLLLIIALVGAIAG